jgi:serine/threonine-protein kinase
VIAPAPSASAAPTSSASAVDASNLRAALREARDARSWRKGADAIVDLAKADPSAFDDHAVVVAAATITSNLEAGAADLSPGVFDALATQAGSGGVDVLYEIMSTRGRSPAALRAAELLRRKDVIDRATPALRIAVDLRDAPCADKLALLGRAKSEGDPRAVAVLDILRSGACNPRLGQCCFRRNPEVEDAIREIRARSRAAP